MRISRWSSQDLSGPQQYVLEDLGALRLHDNKTRKTIIILESNIKMLTSLHAFYERLIMKDDFPLRESCHENILEFTTQLSNMISPLRTKFSHTNALTQIITDRK